jgi:PAS domain S-box-containing protein
MDDLRLLMTRNGYPEEAYFSFSYTPVRDNDGEVVGMFCACTETTEQVKARAAVKAEKDRFDELFQQAPSFMALLRGPDHVIEFANPGYMRLIGYRDVIGKPVREALPEVEGQGYFELLDEGYRTGRAFSGFSSPVWMPRTPNGQPEERFVDFVYQPITGADGAISGIFVEGHDVTERVHGEKELRASEGRYRQIINSATDYAIIASDVHGRVTSWNEGARRLLGWTEEEMLGQPVDYFFTPEDVIARQPLKEMKAALAEGRGIDERWHQRKSGERFWASGELTPLKDDAGTIIGFVKVMRDRTEHRRAEEHQKLLINELNHRVKNTLATIQSLANQTFRGELQEATTRLTFEGRLFALAVAHDVLTREHWEGAGLQEIVSDALKPYSQEGVERFDIKGPELRLSPQMALAIAMALHELATNAVKYGSLSVPSGRVSIEWNITPDAKTFTLRWEEQGGPTVTKPTRKGFGSRLIERSLAMELGGQVRLTYEPTGLVCVVEAPMVEPKSPAEDRNEHP